ncbi:MAG: MMPL family transporter [Kineosporiaceae bacterium]
MTTASPAGARPDPLGRLGWGAARYPVRVLAAWVLAAAGCLAVSGGALGGPGLFGNLDAQVPSAPGDAVDATAVLDADQGGDSVVGAAVRGVDPVTAARPSRDALASAAASARDDLTALPGVESVQDPLAGTAGDPRAAPLLAPDAAGILVLVTVAGDAPDHDATLAAVEERLDRMVAEIAAGVPGVTGAVGGEELTFDRVTEQVEADLRTGELIALPLSLAVMVVVFGGLLAAGIPILGALAAIAGALAALYGFSFLMAVDTSVVTVVSVLGLGLCIDYSLLIVSRYREELLGLQGSTRRGRRDRHAVAMSRTMATAGRTVAFSGLTVALSLAGLLVFDAPVLRAMGAAGLSVVLVAVAVALTLVPALLALAGGRLERPGAASRLPVVGPLVARVGDVGTTGDGVFAAVARRVQARPVLVAAGITALLGVLAVPAAGLDLRNSGVELLPAGDEQREFAEILAADHPQVAEPGATLVAATDDTAAVDAWATGLADLPGVAEVSAARALDGTPDADSAAGVAFDLADPVGAEARALVGDLRSAAADAPFPVLVTGQAATLVDLVDSMRADAPLAIAVVVLATVVLLFLMTGSLLVPVKALLLNLLSLGAAIGVLVWVFQDGRLEGLLGYTSTGGIEVTIVPLVLAFGFGLSMDYEVFLLARIKEFHDQGLANDAAVAEGLQRSGRIVSSAALVLVIVFAGFGTGQLLIIKQMGVALAVAVVLDATLVRMLLVPATMTLLREWNWWAPGPLRRWHHRFGIREGATSPDDGHPATPRPPARPVPAGRHVGG